MFSSWAKATDVIKIAFVVDELPSVARASYCSVFVTRSLKEHMLARIHHVVQK